MIKITERYLEGFITQKDWETIIPEIDQAWGSLINQTGKGNQFLGWLKLPQEMKNHIAAIKKTAEEIRQKSQVVLSLGVGGSYLGGRTAVSALSDNKNPEILFAGHNLSSDYYQSVIEQIQDKDFTLLVISKSGTTLETAVAFAVFKDLLVKKYGEQEARQRIYVITDREKGVLRKEARENDYPAFIITDDVGGRFSVLSPVGLLVMAVAGINIEEVLSGAQTFAQSNQSPDINTNPAARYAGIRNLLHRKNKNLEILSTFEPRLGYLNEWWKQLFGESEGKEGKGIFPASCQFTTDLHSLGQMIQEGPRHFFETFLWIENSHHQIQVPEMPEGLEFASHLSLEQLNHSAYQGVAQAHYQGGVPNLSLLLPELTPYYLGALFFFFEIAAGISGYLLGVNPFDQPGVEAYKKNMRQFLKENQEIEVK